MKSREEIEFRLKDLKELHACISKNPPPSSPQDGFVLHMTGLEDLNKKIEVLEWVLSEYQSLLTKRGD